VIGPDALPLTAPWRSPRREYTMTVQSIRRVPPPRRVNGVSYEAVDTEFGGRHVEARAGPTPPEAGVREHVSSRFR